MINNDFPTPSPTCSRSRSPTSRAEECARRVARGGNQHHYIYSFLKRPLGRGALAINVEDSDVAAQALGHRGFKTITQSDISR